MSTQPIDDSYPENWKPTHLRRLDQERRQQRTEMERTLAAMDPAERTAMLKRIEAGS